MTTDFTVSDYLIARLIELGVGALFGVPGDYNLGFLDRVLETPGLDWVGCANELDAGYAADGYARMRGFGAVATTYGVGEFSALNAIAGARAEDVALVEITGAPSTAAIEAGTAVHHTFGDGDYSRFALIGAQVTVATAFLRGADATGEIDRVLTAAVRHRRPVQLTVPSDVALLPAAPPTDPLPTTGPRTDDAALTRARQDLVETLSAAPAVAILVGHEPARLGLVDAARALVREAGAPSAFLHRGKGVLDESDPRVLGLYAGELSAPAVRATVEGADAVVVLGAMFDGGVVPFADTPPAERLVELRAEETVVAGRIHPVPLPQALDLVRAVLADRSPVPDPADHRPATAPAWPADADDADAALIQASTWSILMRHLRPGQTIAAEAGTSYYAMLASRLPADTAVVAQGMWSSIGYTFPAVLGAQLADPDRRAVLVIGDGSLQLTAAEFGTFHRTGATPIVVVIANDGYTVERAIHGPDEAYNDIAVWDWQRLPQALGAPDALSLLAETEGQLDEALRVAQREQRLVLIEARLPRLDAPPLLLAVAEAVSRRNGYAGDRPAAGSADAASRGLGDGGASTTP